MAVTKFVDNLTLVTQNGNTAAITTDPYPMGGMNYGHAIENIEVLDQTGGGSAKVDLEAQISNDGVEYMALSALSLLANGLTGLAEASGNVTAAYIRFKISLYIDGGSAGDLAWTTLDLHVNFTHT